MNAGKEQPIFVAVFRIHISFYAHPDPGSKNVYMNPDPDPLFLCGSGSMGGQTQQIFN